MCAENIHEFLLRHDKMFSIHQWKMENCLAKLQCNKLMQHVKTFRREKNFLVQVAKGQLDMISCDASKAETLFFEKNMDPITRNTGFLDKVI